MDPPPAFAARIQVSNGSNDDSVLFRDEKIGDLLFATGSSNQTVAMGTQRGTRALLAIGSEAATVTGDVLSVHVTSRTLASRGILLGIASADAPPSIDASNASLLSIVPDVNALVPATNNAAYKLLATPHHEGKVKYVLNHSSPVGASNAAALMLRDAGDTTTLEMVTIPPHGKTRLTSFAGAWRVSA